MWGIWRERNARTFKGCEISTHDMKFFLQTLLEWKNSSGVFTFNSLTDLLDSCSFLFLYFSLFFFLFLSMLPVCFFFFYFFFSFFNVVILLIKKL